MWYNKYYLDARRRSMYIRRKIDAYLIKWRQNTDRLPLIIKGARQTGKTESILHFAQVAYSNVIYIRTN